MPASRLLAFGRLAPDGGFLAAIAANGKDMDYGRDKGLSAAMLDRLLLDEDRVEAMACGIENIRFYIEYICYIRFFSISKCMVGMAKRTRDIGRADFNLPELGSGSHRPELQ